MTDHDNAQEIDTGDTVLHRPTGEEWLVAGVENGRLMWCGWPEGSADVDDCELVRKSDVAKRDSLLHELSGLPHDDMRRRYARRRLKDAE